MTYQLVTGAGGTVGSALCRRLSNPLALGHGENSLYELDVDCPKILADIRDEARLQEIFEKYTLGAIYHLAAHKHVSFCEDNINEAISNNVYGTQLLVRLAKEYGVPRFVYLSTDKAVEPINVYGMTKALAERIVLAAGYTVVRSGNVIGSRGSVIPKWKEQAAKGEPLTITDPEATRYFIGVDTLANVVKVARGNIVVVADTDLVKMGHIARYIGGKDWNVIGLQPGEKKHEKLRWDWEI